MDLDSEDIHGIIEVDSDSGISDEDEFGEASTSGVNVFGAPQQVFVVKALSKATSGFRPSVTCEGFLAELSSTSAGYNMSPLGRDQQLSFKYEPPSPKFSRKRPGCISYRLQLLHGAQFLYSLRGLPKILRCQRAAHAVEWGPVHVVFAALADMDTFLATLKYVEVEHMGPGGEAQAGPAVGPSRQLNAEAPLPCDADDWSSDAGMRWADAAALLLVDGREGDVAGVAPEPHEGSRQGPAPTWPHCQSYGTSLLAATAGAAVLAAVAAYLMSKRGGSRRESTA